MSTSSTDALTQYQEKTFGEDNPLNEVMSDETADIIDVPSAPASYVEVETSMASDAVVNGAASSEPIFLIGEVGDSSPLFGSNEDEFIAGRFGDSVLFGNGGQDTLVGDLEGSGNDKLFAGSGDDEVLGNGGDDIVFGEEGDDFLFGGAGNDYLRGGEGDDSLFGGEGTDIFAVFSGEGTDTVFDFEASRDIIGLGCGVTFDQLTLTQVGNATVISHNGETLINVLNTTATNFTQDTFLSV